MSGAYLTASQCAYVTPIVQGDVFGVAVHAAARVLSLAGDSEVLASWTTRDVLAGSNIRLESRGHHALKGLEGEREVFRVLG